MTWRSRLPSVPPSGSFSVFRHFVPQIPLNIHLKYCDLPTVVSIPASLDRDRLVARLGPVFAALVPEVGLADLAHGRMVPGLADQNGSGIAESPFADVDREAEPRDQGAAGEVAVLFIPANFCPGLLEQSLRDPRRHVRTMAGVDVAEHEQLGQ